jgi:hypothetical protein
MASMNLGSDDFPLLIEALGKLLDDKREALKISIEAQAPFTARDFGIPQIETLLERIETVYNDH